MKSFSEFVKESYNFRLGGSQKKGFEQENIKTFGELKHGDTIYYCRKSDDKAMEMMVEKVKEEKDGSIRIVSYLKRFYPHSVPIIIPIKKENLDDTFISLFPERSSIAGTDFTRFLQGAKKYLNKDLKVDDVHESYNFRLGGSQQKGFNQTNYKTLGELKDGDTIYYFCSFTDKRPDAATITNMHSKYISLEMNSTGNMRVAEINKENLDDVCSVVYHKEYGHDDDFEICSTSKEAMIDNLKAICKNVDTSLLDESYSFRLGGSQNKGFDQTKYKFFSDLVIGDTMYFFSTLTMKKPDIVTIDDIKHKETFTLFTLTLKSDGSHRVIKIVNKDMNDGCIFNDLNVQGAGINFDILSTSKEAMLDCLNSKHKTVDTSLIDESYSFRLGGSQKKGFDQKCLFRDLKKGDIVYYSSLKQYGYEIIEGEVIYRNKNMMKFKTRHGDVIWDWKPGDYEDGTVSWIDYTDFYCVGTSKKEVRDCLENYLESQE